MTPSWAGSDVRRPTSDARPSRRRDGLAATRDIIGVDPDARVVIVTEYDETDLRDAARAAGARGYVLKENLHELRSVLADVARHEPEP